MANNVHWARGLVAILFFKMAAARGRVRRDTRPEIFQYQKLYQCTKFHSFIPICTIWPLFTLPLRGLHTMTNRGNERKRSAKN